MLILHAAKAKDLRINLSEAIQGMMFVQDPKSFQKPLDNLHHYPPPPHHLTSTSRLNFNS